MTRIVEGSVYLTVSAFLWWWVFSVIDASSTELLVVSVVKAVVVGKMLGILGPLPNVSAENNTVSPVKEVIRGVLLISLLWPKQFILPSIAMVALTMGLDSVAMGMKEVNNKKSPENPSVHERE